MGTVTTQSSTTGPAGQVIGQDPTGGTPAVLGTAVDLVVSSRPVQGDLDIKKMQSLDGTGWTSGTLDVSLGESIFCQLTATNTFDVGMAFSGSDILDDQVVFFDEASWDGTANGDLLEYSGTVGALSEIILSFTVKVTDIFDPTDTVIENVATLAYGNHSEKSQIVKARITDPVPEPATIALLGIGLMSTFALARRRRRARK